MILGDKFYTDNWKEGENMKEREIVLHNITIYLVRKKIKNLYIRIKPPEARVVVSVPLHTPESVIAKFLEEHWGWIIQKRKEVLDREMTADAVPQYQSGEEHGLWGKSYELQVERSLKRPMTEVKEGKIYMRVPARSTVEERRKQLDSWYQSKMEEVLPDIIQHYEQVVGRHANEWRFRRMKTRWGTCNIQKKRICLNIQLAEMPVECLAYVVTHELTHLHEAGHNERFWGLMDRFYPKWREVREYMKKQ